MELRTPPFAVGLGADRAGSDKAKAVQGNPGYKIGPQKWVHRDRHFQRGMKEVPEPQREGALQCFRDFMAEYAAGRENMSQS